MVRTRKWWVWAALLLAAVVFFFVLKAKKETLVRDCLDFLQSQFNRSADFQFTIGKVRGHLSGFVELEDVEVRRPWLPGEEAVIFKAKDIRLRYRLLDFLSKKFDSKVEIALKSPEIRWRPRVGMRRTEFPFLEWLKEWVVAQKDVFVIRAEDLTVVYGSGGERFEGVELFYEKNHVTADVPIRHWPLSDQDVSTTLRVDARMEEALHPRNRLFSGTMRTEGTVVNWRPVPQESSFDFIFSEQAFEVVSSSLFGGVEITGKIDFTKDNEMDFEIRAGNFPLSNFGPLMNWDPHLPQPGRLDLEARFKGDVFAPLVEAHARIDRGWAGRAFKTLEVNVSGAYPTVRLSDSRIVLEDGTTMAIAPSVLEIGELFKSDTYKALITHAEQETVVMGSWQFSRIRDIKDQPEFLAERSLGENARVQFRKYNEESNPFTASESQTSQMELGFEVGPKSKDSLKVALRDEGEFVGVERKVSF
jgi:hypothetical protein